MPVLGALALAAAYMFGRSFAPSSRAQAADGPVFGRRWVFVHSQLATPGGVDRVLEIMRRAKAARYNGIVLTEATLSAASVPSDAERERAQRLRAAAASLGLEIIPTVFSPTSILRQDPNLAEAMPVRNALFIVRDGVATFTPDPVGQIANPGFEERQGSSPARWSVRTEDSTSAAIDRGERHSGSRSLRITAAPTADAGHVTVSQNLAVEPYRQYHLSVWARTSGFSNAGALQPWVMGAGNRALNYSQWRLEPDAGWKRFDAVFNSQSNTQVAVRLSVHRSCGTLWLDTISLEEIGLLNLVRRPGCPLTVSGSGGAVYEEGRDFEPVTDRLMGRTPVPGAFSAYHAVPEGIRLTSGSRIPSAAQLRVSYYHAPVIFEGRVAQCLTEPAAYELMRKEIERVKDLLAPKTYFMSHDEIRVINWCQTCIAQKKTPGELLADNARRCVRIIRDVSPGARIVVWSDMFDPHHNAKSAYYLANGTVEGAWEGLPRDVIIMNWNHTARKASMEWFASRGHGQIIAGYYDRPTREIRQWLDDARVVPSVSGIMFTTWKRNYVDLEEFARQAWR